MNTLYNLASVLLPFALAGVGVPLLLLVLRPVINGVLSVLHALEGMRARARVRRSFRPYCRRAYY